MVSVPLTAVVMEGAGTVQVCVTLTGSLERNVVVSVATQDVTALGECWYSHVRS